MNKLVKRAAMVASVGAAGATGVALAPATPAGADSPIVSSGGGADCRGQWLSGANAFRIDDMASDGNYCYVHYGRTAQQVQDGAYRLEARSGADAGWMKRSVGSEINGWGGIRFRVCENIGSGPDECSNIVGPYAL